MLRESPPSRGRRDDLLLARLRLARPKVWPPAPGQCPLCGRRSPKPAPAARYQGAPAHDACLSVAFPPVPPLTDLGVRPDGVVPFGFSYVAQITHTMGDTAYAAALPACRPTDLVPGAVLLIATRFGQVLQALVYRGEPVTRGFGFQLPLAVPLELGPGEWGRVCVRRPRGRGPGHTIHDS